MVLIDIGAGSVAGAYVHLPEGELPLVLYSRRLLIEPRIEEPAEAAMLRTLERLGEMLVREGAPALLRATGSGSAESVLVAVDAPWQETQMRIEVFEDKRPFVFTKSILNDALLRESVAPAHKILIDESVVGTTLNGYEVANPYGKRTSRAQVIILTSFIEEQVGRALAGQLQSLYHTREIVLISGTSLRYQAIRAIFPHDRDCIILDALGPEIAIALVKNGLLVASVDMPDGEAGSPLWVQEVTETLGKLAKQHPLPHTIFLLAREEGAERLKSILSSADLGRLWLSDDPPKVVPVLASHLASFTRLTTDASPDLVLSLIAMYAKRVGEAA